MDLGLSEQQELLKNAARDFLEKECPETHVREMEEDEKGYSPDLWKHMAELGWQGLVIPDAHLSAHMTVVARTKKGKNAEDGVTLFIVDSKSPGISFTQLKTIAADKQCEVKFENVKVPKANVLGAVDKGRPIFHRIARKATVLECAYLVGLAQKDFEISVQYAKDRIQFGRPIGSFQAIQHKAADMVTDVDGARFITYKAAWSVAEDTPEADLDVHMAKAWCSEATRRVVAHGQQIHGGVGFTKEYIIQLFFRRQKAAELAWGDADYHREHVAELLKG